MVRQRCPNSRKESVAAVGCSGRVRTRTSLKKVFDRKPTWDWMIWVLVWVVVLFLLGAFVQVVHLPRGAKRWWWRLSSLNPIPYHSKDRNGVPAAAWMPRRNTNLEIRLGKLIQQAKADAASKGIFTEMRASLLRTEQHKQRMKTYEADMAILRDAVNGMKRKVILCYTNADCGRGACVGSKCVCAVGYVGTQCTRPIHLIIEKEEQDIETQRRIILPLGGTDYFTDRMFGEEQELFAQCNVFFSRKEEEGYHSTGKDSDIESFVLYPNPEHEKAKASHEEDEQEDKDSILHAYVEHVFGSVGATEENMHALETLFTSLRECLSVHMYPGSHDTLLHKYVLQNLEQSIPRGFVVHE
jgi:hypothetical protein